MPEFTDYYRLVIIPLRAQSITKAPPLSDWTNENQYDSVLYRVAALAHYVSIAITPSPVPV